MFFKLIKHILQMLHVISWNQTKNNDVINVAFDKTKACQHLVHDYLEFHKGVFQTKWLEPPKSFPQGPIPQNAILTLSPSLNGSW